MWVGRAIEVGDEVVLVSAREGQQPPSRAGTMIIASRVACLARRFWCCSFPGVRRLILQVREWSSVARGEDAGQKCRRWVGGMSLCGGRKYRAIHCGGSRDMAQACTRLCYY